MNLNPCRTSPCLNSGLCDAISVNEYVCQCAPTYVGDNCEFEVTTTTTTTTTESPAPITTTTTTTTTTSRAPVTRSSTRSTSEQALTTLSIPVADQRPPIESIAPIFIENTCETFCYNDGICNGTECMCRSGTNGTNCENIVGCLIPKSLQIIPVGGIIHYQCSGNSGQFFNTDVLVILV